jgi:hypothetical protein
VALATATMAVATPASAAPASGPTISNPPALGAPMAASSLNLAAAGWTESEKFVAGTAALYNKASTWGSDGTWPVRSDGTVDYATRVIVRAPSDPTKFNGTVVVEWINVTNGFDADVDFLMASSQFLRSGTAYVGVSAQVGGVNYLRNGSPPLFTFPNRARYDSLGSWTNDGASYDIFSQVAQTLRSDPASILGAGYTPTKLLASGHSQSASRLVTYYNAIQPVSKAFDGFLIHGRSAGAAPIQNFIAPPGAASQTPPEGTPAAIVAVESGVPARLRTDGPPALVLEAETDAPGHYAARQSDSATYRLWEVAGASHADQFFLDQGRPAQRRDVVGFPDLKCGKAFNSFPFRFVLHSGLEALRTWVTTGTAPGPSVTISIDSAKLAAATTTADRFAAVNRDPSGNALGGVRLPQIDAATIRYEPFGFGGICDSFTLVGLLGGQVPLTKAQLKARYRTTAAYQATFNTSLDNAVAQGWLLPIDAWFSGLTGGSVRIR